MDQVSRITLFQSSNDIQQGNRDRMQITNSSINSNLLVSDSKIQEMRESYYGIFGKEKQKNPQSSPEKMLILESYKSNSGVGNKSFSFNLFSQKLQTRFPPTQTGSQTNIPESPHFKLNQFAPSFQKFDQIMSQRSAQQHEQDLFAIGTQLQKQQDEKTTPNSQIMKTIKPENHSNFFNQPKIANLSLASAFKNFNSNSSNRNSLFPNRTLDINQFQIDKEQNGMNEYGDFQKSDENDGCYSFSMNIRSRKRQQIDFERDCLFYDKNSQVDTQINHKHHTNNTTTHNNIFKPQNGEMIQDIFQKPVQMDLFNESPIAFAQNTDIFGRNRGTFNIFEDGNNQENCVFNKNIFQHQKNLEIAREKEEQLSLGERTHIRKQHQPLKDSKHYQYTIVSFKGQKSRIFEFKCYADSDLGINKYLQTAIVNTKIDDDVESDEDIVDYYQKVCIDDLNQGIQRQSNQAKQIVSLIDFFPLFFQKQNHITAVKVFEKKEQSIIKGIRNQFQKIKKQFQSKMIKQFSNFSLKWNQ